MEFATFLTLSAAVFLALLGNFLFGSSRVHGRLGLWLSLFLLLGGVIATSWFVEDATLRWVLIELSTLFGALLISMTRSQRALDVAWKFLLINSFGLGIAFLGIIVLLFASGSPNSRTLFSLLPLTPRSPVLLEVGLWLAVFGYSAKLGLFPNHFWVGDTYAEAPNQVAALLASFIPVAVCIPLRNLLRLDHTLHVSRLNASDGLLLLGVLTMLYSVWTLYQTQDLDRLGALVGLFHSGALAVLLWFRPDDRTFWFLMATNVVMKSVLFTSLGALRFHVGNHRLEALGAVPRGALWLFLLALACAFVLPLSPVFISDMLLVRAGALSGHLWALAVPVLGLAFFSVGVGKVLPMTAREHLRITGHGAAAFRTRMGLSLALLALTVALGLWGLTRFPVGGFYLD